MNLQVIAIPAIETDGTNYTGPHFPGAGELALASAAMLQAGLVARLESAGATVSGCCQVELSAEDRSGDPQLDLGRLATRIANCATTALAEDSRILLAGGSCAHVPGIIAGLQEHFGDAARIGILWFDAHADLNTPQSSRSGLLLGMPLAVCAGLGGSRWRESAGIRSPIPTDRILLLDVRDLDPFERDLIAATDISVVTLDEDNAAKAIEDLATRVDHLYVHIDADILDSRYQPNAPISVPGGPSIEAVSAALQTAMHTGKVRAFGVVSFNPSGDGGQRSLETAMQLTLEGVSAWQQSQPGARLPG